MNLILVNSVDTVRITTSPHLPKIEEITVGQAHVNTQNILMDAVVFLNQKRANVCEHITKMALF